ncbi:MAG: ATP-binding cassette domain-containing protein [Polyangiaceae bacterium]|nr:ATP-binding cassette domain-containing protein [Polyangiaceae bacterium]
MIEATGLTKSYGGFRALDRVSFKVRRGEVVGFLGPNGAGKSTTMRILTCYISASAGTARVNGFDVFDDPLAVRRSLGYLPQRAPLYGEMSVIEYLRFVAEMRQLDHMTFNKTMKSVVEVCGLAAVLNKEIRTLSHGYRQRVGLGQALVHNPRILILDEPTSDLDPNEKAEVLRYIKEIGKDRTVILSTHNLAEVEEACARAIIVSKGRVVADGDLEEVRARGGRVRYTVTIHEQRMLGGGANYRKDPNAKPPTALEVQRALESVKGATQVKELPTDDQAHRFSLLGPASVDFRPDLFELVVQRGWLMLEMRRDVQKLEDVFRSLTLADEKLDRGRPLRTHDDEDEGAEDEDEPPARPKAAAKPTAAEEPADDEDEDEDEDDEAAEPAKADADAEDEDEDEDEDAEEEEEEEPEPEPEPREKRGAKGRAR